MEGEVQIIAEVPGRPSGLGFLPDGRLLMATALDRKLLSVSPDGTVNEECDMSSLAQGLLNDMVVDGQGRAYVGDTGFNMAAGESPRPGRLLLWSEGQEARMVAEDVVFPNGCIVTADHQTLLIAETMASRISRFTIERDGSLSQRAVFAELASPPDGLCLDVDGGVWAGLPHESAFVHLGVDGRETTRLASPYPFAVTCVLGGPGRRTLFLCSADTDLQRLPAGDTDGRIDALDVEIAGVGWP
jgi:sugar lactone lactonase YvrE